MPILVRDVLQTMGPTSTDDMTCQAPRNPNTTPHPRPIRSGAQCAPCRPGLRRRRRDTGCVCNYGIWMRQTRLGASTQLVLGGRRLLHEYDFETPASCRAVSCDRPKSRAARTIANAHTPIHVSIVYSCRERRG